VGFAFDFDADGDEDIWEGNDFGPNVLWENDGGGHFHERADSDFAGHSAYTMGVSLADYDNEGAWSLYAANMSSEAGQRICAIADGIDEPMRARIEGIASGGALYRQSPDGKSWPRVPGAAGTWEGEWSWGSVFFDVDGDGDEDLYVTNGFTSHSRPELPDWDSTTGARSWPTEIPDARAGSVDERRRSLRGSFSGHQRDRLFYNLDGENASDAPGTSGWTRITTVARSSRSTSTGRNLDLALWTLQGLRLYLRQGTPASFACLDLVAKSSQHHALGAVVTPGRAAPCSASVRCVEGSEPVTATHQVDSVLQAHRSIAHRMAVGRGRCIAICRPASSHARGENRS
jgi:hypothetical protein